MKPEPKLEIRVLPTVDSPQSHLIFIYTSSLFKTHKPIPSKDYPREKPSI
ncbi:hypothetical protein COLO4_33827 [Corchorus olitorius]|uniref:Uncharacterized protein n=1 Tax=Corchorus olitorius TaxID=93759 RepID=A0A1R3GQY6_9ROSI|nr:hypothetical protein COLO4_33827 [Corchorus olitorius]